MKIRQIVCAVTLALTGFAIVPSAAFAASNLIQNGSFEIGNFNGDPGSQPGLPAGSTDLSSWAISGVNNPSPVSWLNNPNAGLSAQDGSYFLDLSGYNDNSVSNDLAGHGAVSQSISTVTGQKYNLTFYVGSNAGYGQPVQVKATAGGATQLFTSASTGSNVWDLETLQFTAGVGNSTLITLAGGVAGAPAVYIGLDNVSVTAVPEPAIWAMLLLGFFGIGFIMRDGRRKDAAAVA